jgi:hypothetical protein
MWGCSFLEHAEATCGHSPQQERDKLASLHLFVCIAEGEVRDNTNHFDIHYFGPNISYVTYYRTHTLFQTSSQQHSL